VQKLARVEEEVMRRVPPVLLCILLMAGCRNENNATTGTTTASTTDTSGTALPIDTSGTETTGTTSTTSTGSSGGTISSLETPDKQFVMKAAQGGMAEVMLGQIAASKGTSADVRNFGNRMVSDHGKANDELKQLAQNKGLALPAEADKESRKFADRLAKVGGKDFDKEYINDMVNDHEKDVNELEKALRDAKDPDLRAWAARTLPMIQDHLKMAKDIKAKLK
jgi:putative membrane protein